MIKAGIIGLGVGEQHISGYNSHSYCKVIKLCDFSENKRNDVQSRYPDITIVDNSNEILQDPHIDVV